MKIQSAIQSSPDTMQSVTVKILRIALVVFILVTIGMKLMDYQSLLPLIFLAVIMTIGTILMILHMATTGKVKAKGAKRRRKHLLPFIYDRKKIHRSESINRAIRSTKPRTNTRIDE
ncbi:hypothetical protein Q0590_20390 [Rhodocytophaga aerolata]|uniref:DUF2892 domain-containing protein n=1 Tax=Rhodocytophaga aerolata TaxID=455078 RepID=A0ABT8RBT9_9BACT|nr:hypothetical protein [Rhodocytophaga aerolata]MDO1448648.1 hypothetical protein [Rhodocytophaga aerolata]